NCISLYILRSVPLINHCFFSETFNRFSGSPMKHNRRRAVAAAIAMAAICATGSAWADSYPTKPITLVVAYPAGGDTDALARLFAEKLSARVGQPVVVDNRPGAS